MTPSKSTIWKVGDDITLWCRNLLNTASASWSSLISTVISHVDSMYPWYMWRKWHFLCGLPKIRNLSLLMRKLTDPNWGTFYIMPGQYDLKGGIFYNIPDQYPSILSRLSKTVKIWETVTAKMSLKRQRLNVIWYPGWDHGT